MVAVVTAALRRAGVMALILGSAVVGHASVAALPRRPATAAAAVSAANEWMTLIDRQRWADSWTKAGKMFRSQVAQARWVAMIKPARQPLGEVAARRLKNATAAKSLPGAPDGTYEVITFTTNFARKKDATETIILARESAGWKVAGYFLR